MKTICQSFAIFIAVLTVHSATAAHPAHSSLTEIEWNADSGNFEVAMKLSIPDLEDAISAEDQRRFRIRDDESTEQRISKYLQKHFALTSGTSVKVQQKWIGMELELHEAWFYFELQTNHSANARKSAVKDWDQLFHSPSPTWTPENVTIRHSALCEVQPEQSNIVSYSANGRKTSLVLNVKQLQAPVTFQQAKRGWGRPSNRASKTPTGVTP